MAYYPATSSRRQRDPYSPAEVRRQIRTDGQAARMLDQRSRRQDQYGFRAQGPVLSQGVSVGTLSPTHGLTPDEEASNTALMDQRGADADRRQSNQNRQDLSRIQAREFNPGMPDMSKINTPWGTGSSADLSPEELLARKTKGTRGTINGQEVATMYPRRRAQSDPYLAVK